MADYERYAPMADKIVLSDDSVAEVIDGANSAIKVSVVSGGSTPEPGDTINASAETTIPDDSLVALFPARTSRKKLVVTASQDNTDRVFIGGPDAAFSEGIPLYPGATLTLDSDCGMAWHAYHNNGVGEVIQYTEIYKA